MDFLYRALALQKIDKIRADKERLKAEKAAKKEEDRKRKIAEKEAREREERKRVHDDGHAVGAGKCESGSDQDDHSDDSSHDHNDWLWLNL